MRKPLGIALAVFIATPVMAGGGNQIKQFFLNTGVQPAATGRLVFISNPAQSKVKISVSKLAAGTYDVILDGAVVDTLVVNAKGKGNVQHRSRPASKKTSATPLLYDPRGGTISIASAGTTVLEGDVPETPEEGQQHIEIEADLENLGVIAGEAEASFEARSGRMQFEVEVEDVPTGVYDLLVDGMKVGEIHVGIGNEGHIEFDSIPEVGDDDDEGEEDEGEGGLDNLLTFDPRGKTITIAQNGTDLFSSVFPTVSTGHEGDDGDDQGDDDDDDSEGGEGDGGDF